MSEFKDLNQAKHAMIERLKELERVKLELVNQVETTVQLDQQLSQERAARIEVPTLPIYTRVFFSWDLVRHKRRRRRLDLG